MANDNNPYGQGYADGHKGNSYNNQYPAESYRSTEYYKGYQQGSTERDSECLSTTYPSFEME